MLIQIDLGCFAFVPVVIVYFRLIMLCKFVEVVFGSLALLFFESSCRLLNFVRARLFDFVFWLFQDVSTFSKLFNVFQIFLLCWLSNVLVFLVYASLFAVVLSCGVCFGWIYVVLGCFTMFFLLSCFNLC